MKKIVLIVALFILALVSEGNSSPVIGSGNKNDLFCPNGKPDKNKIREYIDKYCPYVQETIEKYKIPVDFVSSLKNNYCGSTKCPTGDKLPSSGNIQIRVCNRDKIGTKGCDKSLFCEICGILTHELNHLIYCLEGRPKPTNSCEELAIEILMQNKTLETCLTKSPRPFEDPVCENQKKALECYCLQLKLAKLKDKPCWFHLDKVVDETVRNACNRDNFKSKTSP